MLSLHLFMQRSIDMSPRRRLQVFALGALVVLCTGCSSVRLRPDGAPEPQDCPRKTLDAMARMGLNPGDSFTVVMDERLKERFSARLKEGPVVGYLDRPHEQLPERTRLFGQVWTAAEVAIIRYEAVQIPGGRRMPFCAEVDDSSAQVKDPASPNGVAIVQDSIAFVKVVARYGENGISQQGGRLYLYKNVEDLPPEVREKLKQ
jgi:hypothetical protein